MLWFHRRCCILINDPTINCNLQEIYLKPEGLPPPPPISNPKEKLKPTKNNILDQIENIRAKNNKNWMDILRLTFKFAPEEAGKIMKQIGDCDQEITGLTRRLIK